MSSVSPRQAETDMIVLDEGKGGDMAISLAPPWHLVVSPCRPIAAGLFQEGSQCPIAPAWRHSIAELTWGLEFILQPQKPSVVPHFLGESRVLTSLLILLICPDGCCGEWYQFRGWLGGFSGQLIWSEMRE